VGIGCGPGSSPWRSRRSADAHAIMRQTGRRSPVMLGVYLAGPNDTASGVGRCAFGARHQYQSGTDQQVTLCTRTSSIGMFHRPVTDTFEHSGQDMLVAGFCGRHLITPAAGRCGVLCGIVGVFTTSADPGDDRSPSKPGTGEDTRHRGAAVSGATGIESALASSGRLLTTSHGEVLTNCCNRW